MFSKGYAAAEVEDNYGRALVIDRELGGKQPLPVLWGLWIYHHVRGRYLLAYGFTEQLLALAREAPDPNTNLCAQLSHGSTALMRGMLDHAREYLQRTLELYSVELYAAHAHVFGQDPGVFAGVMLSWNHWLLGYPQRARQTAAAALELGRGLAHPNSLAFALGMKAALHTYCGEAEDARVLSEELLGLCAEQGLAHWVGLAQVVHGWAIADLGSDQAGAVNEGLREALAGRAAWQAVGSGVADTHWAALLVEIYGRAKQPEAALEVLANAFAFLEQSDERTFEPELHRLKGELLLGASDANAAKACFEIALATAERQGSRCLGLRASISLYRLHVARGEEAEGRALLSRSLQFFAAAESTRDLVTARRLLSDGS
jgi:adenylate cyclase